LNGGFCFFLTTAAPGLAFLPGFSALPLAEFGRFSAAWRTVRTFRIPLEHSLAGRQAC
jgi:hypothetical protein